MLKEAVRRLLWLGPTLLVVTLPIFWAIAKTADRVARAPESPLPLFWNPRPEGVRERALAAVPIVAAGGVGASTASDELVRLGGAALPHVLTQFDALGPDARGRVAVSLAPIARRMGIGSGAELDSPEVAVVFWARFWEEHAIDFRPAVVRRTVRRFIEHPSALRASEVSELDTVALEDLVDALGAVRTAEDVTRVRHVTELLSRMTDVNSTVPPGARPEAAARIANRWRSWWFGSRSDFLAFTGPRRLVATLLETRYGHWLERLVRPDETTAVAGRTVNRLRSRGPTTLLLVACGFFVGYPLAVLAGILAALHAPRARDVLVSVMALFLATIGVVGISGALAGPGGKNLASACAAMMLATAAGAFRQRRSIARRAFELTHTRTARAFGASRLHAALRTARQSFATVVAVAVADLPGLLTAAFVVEHVFSLRGIGKTTIDALRSGDQAWLLTVALAGTLTVGVAQIAADVLLVALDPRLLPRLSRSARANP